ncbi:virulence factor BrkB family protein [Candidatus Albibeggiatoa sp. nov. BB20]|uniref:virulence factor BrkB family protein n=1 Tax=Candidatus Albibeggiatoa sp. nov. BB20 TaxID=3162723 RepID=UPI0033657A09
MVKFGHYVAMRFITDRCAQTSAALTYATLLSLVPMLAVGFSILAVFPVFNSVSDQLQDFIFKNFVPASQEIIQEYFISFAKKASQLTALGVIFLVITALLLMETIDHALNDIWEVRKRERRQGVSVFMMYWVVLSLGPLLVGVSIVATFYLAELPVLSDVADTLEIREQILRMSPFLLSTAAFTLIYVTVPYRHVPLYHGIFGGLIAAILFEIAKRGFAFYVTRFPTYELVYGTLAVIPIFLIWVYLSWLIILLGAEVTRSMTSYHRPEEQAIPCVLGNALIWAYRILGHLRQAQKSCQDVSFKKLLSLESSLPDTSLEALLNHLHDKQWIHHTEKGNYVLSRDIHESTLFDLYQDLSGLLFITSKNGH